MYCGCQPRCALEKRDAGESRIGKILGIIDECSLGIHDISRTECDTKYNLPRFNMPLELGIFLGAQYFGSGSGKNRSCLIFDREKYRFQKFISDIAGQDITPHRNKPKIALVEIRNWILTRHPTSLLDGGNVIYTQYRIFLRDFPRICEQLNLRICDVTYADLCNVIEWWFELARRRRRYPSSSTSGNKLVSSKLLRRPR